MQEYKNVRGSQEKIDGIEFNVDTIYIRTNIRREKELINEKEFEFWVYDEIQYTYNEYLEVLDKKNKIQENTNNEQDELIISNAANIAIMLEATGANTISTLAIEEDRVLEEEKMVGEKSVLFNVLKRSIENGANVATTKKRIELFKRTKQLTEEEATELLAMLA